MAAPEGIVSRFMRQTDKRGEDECWEWKGYKRGGYGSFKIFGRMTGAHRISFELFVGPVGKDLMVCHKCDNATCVNPNHLFLGTAQMNMDDKIQKGRHRGAAKGSRHHLARLCEGDVREIRKLLAQKVTQKNIADIYGVSQTEISNISTGKRWGHVL